MKHPISFIINSLSVGGAQMMLLKLLTHLNRDIFMPEVVTLTLPGALADKFREIGVPVTSLGMRQGIPDPRSLFRLARHFKVSRPDLVQTWMYHADLLGGITARMAASPPVIWNIRHSNLDRKVDKLTTILAARTCALLSDKIPVKIICCAHKAREIHVRLGYASERMCVIPNGFELDRFKPDPQARSDIRKELGIDRDALIIGYVSRFHPQKDHLNFVRAAAVLYDDVPDVHYVLCGDDVDWNNPTLSTAIRQSGLDGAFHLLGRRTDIPQLTASFDIAVLASSCGEAFSNTIGEAMACAIPCVVTDVGDSAMIVGDAGRVVAPGDAAALADAWQKLISLGPQYRASLGNLGRQRVLDNFSLDMIVTRYQQLYLDILQSHSLH